MVRKTTFCTTILLLGLSMAPNWTFQDGYTLEGSPAKADAVALFKQAADLVMQNAAEPVSESDLVDASLETMLNKLDPHSSYYPPATYKELMEDQEGKFSGLGMMVTKPTATSPLLVVLPLPDTPASRAGIRAGDTIIEIDGDPTDKMTSREAVRRLKGPEGTEVTLKLGRGESGEDRMTLKRASIPKHTVPYSFLLDGGIGYIKLNLFGQTSPDEMETALRDLDRKGMRALVLDLRDNPGGALTSAVAIASLFLKSGQDVVSVRGRSIDRQVYHRAPRDGKYVNLPIAILVNQSSASASEIVSGALQDHDRAVVVGETTWGKGLVQTLHPLDRGAAAITTARYYTPSGRLIQRDFTRSLDDYLFPDIAAKGEEKPAPLGKPLKTDSGRSVYSGGGIAPDIFVKNDKIPPLALRLERKRAFLEFVAKEIESDRVKSGNREETPAIDRFAAYLAAQKETYTKEEWQESLAYMTQAIERESATMLKDQGAGYRAMIPLDKQLAEATRYLREELGKRVKKAA